MDIENQKKFNGKFSNIAAVSPHVKIEIREIIPFSIATQIECLEIKLRHHMQFFVYCNIQTIWKHWYEINNSFLEQSKLNIHGSLREKKRQKEKQTTERGRGRLRGRKKDCLCKFLQYIRSVTGRFSGRKGVRTEFRTQKGNICMLLLLQLRGLFSESKRSSKPFWKMRLSSFLPGVSAEPVIPPWPGALAT